MLKQTYIILIIKLIDKFIKTHLIILLYYSINEKKTLKMLGKMLFSL